MTCGKNVFQVTKVLILVLLLCISSYVFGSRVPPPEIKPILIDGISYEPRYETNWRAKSSSYVAYIAAFDNKTKKEIWRVKIYTVFLSKDMEGDIQFVYVKTFTEKDNKLNVQDERGGSFSIDIDSREVVPSDVVYKVDKDNIWLDKLLILVLGIFIGVLVYVYIRMRKCSSK